MKRALLLLIALVLLVAPINAQELDNNEELFSVDLKKNEALIFINIQDKNGTPLSGVIVSVKQGRYRKPFSRVSDRDGKIRLVVSYDDTYEIRFLSLDISQNEHVEKFDIPAQQDLRYGLYMTYKEPKTKVFVLEGVFFNTGKATLKAHSFKPLGVLLEYLKMKKDVEIELGGHTDNVGSDEDNQKLSEARANTVRRWLIKKGIASNRISAFGYGESKPRASNDTAQGRRKNRRTEVRITSD